LTKNRQGGLRHNDVPFALTPKGRRGEKEKKGRGEGGKGLDLLKQSALAPENSETGNGGNGEENRIGVSAHRGKDSIVVPGIK